jgi:hypothetical protein
MNAAWREVKEPKKSAPWAQWISMAVRKMKAVLVFWMDRTDARGISMKVRGTPEKKQMRPGCRYQ